MKKILTGILAVGLMIGLTGCDDRSYNESAEDFHKTEKLMSTRELKTYESIKARNAHWRLDEFRAEVRLRREKPSNLQTVFCDLGEVIQRTEEAFVDHRVFHESWEPWYNQVTVHGCLTSDEARKLQEQEIAAAKAQQAEMIAEQERLKAIADAELLAEQERAAQLEQHSDDHGDKILDENKKEFVGLDAILRIQEEARTCRPARNALLEVFDDQGNLLVEDYGLVMKKIIRCRNVNLENQVMNSAE